LTGFAFTERQRFAAVSIDVETSLSVFRGVQSFCVPDRGSANLALSAPVLRITCRSGRTGRRGTVACWRADRWQRQDRVFVIFAELTVAGGAENDSIEDAMLHLRYGRQAMERCCGRTTGIMCASMADSVDAQTRRLAFEISRRRERLWRYTRRFGPMGVDPRKKLNFWNT
jgi:hypothetical protein